MLEKVSDYFWYDVLIHEDFTVNIMQSFPRAQKSCFYVCDIIPTRQDTREKESHLRENNC